MPDREESMFPHTHTHTLLNNISHISLMCVQVHHTHTHTPVLVWLFERVPRQVSARRGVSRCGPPCKRGALISLTTCSRGESVGWEMEFERAGKLCQQVTEACADQTRSEVKRSHITGANLEGSIMHYSARLSHTACQCTEELCCCSNYELNIGLL